MLPTVNTATISKPHESETFRVSFSNQRDNSCVFLKNHYILSPSSLYSSQMILESEMGGAKNHPGIGSKQFDRQLSNQVVTISIIIVIIIIIVCFGIFFSISKQESLFFMKLRIACLSPLLSLLSPFLCRSLTKISGSVSLCQ